DMYMPQAQGKDLEIASEEVNKCGQYYHLLKIEDCHLELLDNDTIVKMINLLENLSPCSRQRFAEKFITLEGQRQRKLIGNHFDRFITVYSGLNATQQKKIMMDEKIIDNIKNYH